MTQPEPPEPAEPSEDKKARQARRRGDFFGISALASALLSGLAGDKLSQSLDSGGWISVVGFSLTVGFALIWAIYNAPVGLRKYRAWRSAVPRQATELHAAAEEAEQWLVSLGSDAGGMAAAEWFEQNEPRLRELLLAEKPQEEVADDIARICDALDTWYVRKRAAGDLLTMSEHLAAFAEACGRPELAELAAARAATAYRLMGDLESATRRLGTSTNIAPPRRGHSRTAAALRTRREVESALCNLARAETIPAGNDRDEPLSSARNRLDDASLFRPGPDLAGDVAIQINLAIVQLHQQDPVGALDQLRAAAARASAAGDLSGQAHALELTGVAAWMQRSPHEARRWWEHAEHLYAEIDEREGRARCLQHLGSAAVLTGQLDQARELLEQSALLRGGVSDDHPLLRKYLAAANDGDVPVVSDEPPLHSAGWLRRFLLRLRRSAG